MDCPRVGERELAHAERPVEPKALEVSGPATCEVSAAVALDVVVDVARHDLGPPQILGPALTPLKDSGIWKSRLVDYDGVTAQALRDLSSWVEDGIAPPMSTGYSMTSDGQITLSADAKERGGVQPVAHATANGAARAEVKVGEAVTLVGTAHQPPGTGTIVAAEWDFAGRGAYEPQAVEGNAESVTVEASHVYDEPGTYFASFRVGSHRDGVDGKPPFARNNARVRVVVHP